MTTELKELEKPTVIVDHVLEEKLMAIELEDPTVIVDQEEVELMAIEPTVIVDLG